MSNWLKHFTFLCGWLLAAVIVAFVAISCARTRGAEIPSAPPNPQSAVLLDFYADWCGPCQTMGPTISGLTQAGYRVERVNIDENRTLAARYGVETHSLFCHGPRGARDRPRRRPGQLSPAGGQCSRRPAAGHWPSRRHPPRSNARSRVNRRPPGDMNGRSATARPSCESTARTIRACVPSAAARWSSGRVGCWFSPRGTSSKTPSRFSSGSTPARPTGPACSRPMGPGTSRFWKRMQRRRASKRPSWSLARKPSNRKATGWNLAAMGPTASWRATMGCSSGIGDRAWPRAGPTIGW